MECVEKKELSWKFVKCQKWMRSILWLLLLVSQFIRYRITWCVVIFVCIHSCLPSITYYISQLKLSPKNSGWPTVMCVYACRDHFRRWNDSVSDNSFHYMYIILINPLNSVGHNNKHELIYLEFRLKCELNSIARLHTFHTHSWFSWNAKRNWRLFNRILIVIS